MKSIDDIKLPASNGTENKLRKTSKARILKVAEMIRNGYSRTKAIEAIMETEGLSFPQAARYWYAAVDYLTPTPEESAGMRAEIMETLREVIAQGMIKGDKTAVVKALDILNKMMGNYTEKIDATVNSEININFNIDTEPDNDDGTDD